MFIFEDSLPLNGETKEIKFICDLLLDDFTKEVGDSRIVKSLLNRYHYEFDTRGIFETYRDALANNPQAQEDFSARYRELLYMYKASGTQGVLQSTGLLERLCRYEFKNNKKFYGKALEDAVAIQTDYVARYFKLEGWDAETYANCQNLLRSIIGTWVDRQAVTTQRELGTTTSNIINVTDRSGIEGQIIGESAEVNTADHLKDLTDPKIYVDIINDISKGTNVLMKRNSSTAIEGEMYSILNYFYELEQRSFCIKMKSKYKFLDKRDFNFDANDVTPHTYKANGSLMEGHKVTIRPEYADSGIGNVDGCNKRVKSGKVELILYIEALDRVKSKLKPNDRVVASFIVNDIRQYLYSKGVATRGFVEVSQIVGAILACERLKVILKRNGYSLLQFPIIEVREGTWSRFSCLYELLHYYRIHFRLQELQSLNIIDAEYANSRHSPVSIIDVVKRLSDTNKSSYEEYLENNFSDVRLDNRRNLSSSAIRLTAEKISHEPVFKVTLVKLENIYSSGLSLLESFSDVLVDDNIMSAVDIYASVYLPLISICPPSLSFGDMPTPRLMQTMIEYGNGVLEKTMKAQLDALKLSHKRNDYNRTNNLFNVVIERLESVLISKDISDYRDFLDNLDTTLIGVFEPTELCKECLASSNSNRQALYFIFCNIKVAIFLYDNVTTVANILLGSGDNSYRTISVDEAQRDLLEAVSNNFDDILSVLLKILSFRYCKDFYSRDRTRILECFVDYLEKQYNITIQNRARITDFTAYLNNSANKNAIDCLMEFVQVAVDTLEDSYMTNMIANLNTETTESYWASVKSKVARDFYDHVQSQYADDITNNVVAVNYRQHDELAGLPTLPNSSIIGLVEPVRFYLEDSNDYFVYSVFGYKMLLKSGLGVVTKMSDYEIKLISEYDEWDY